jgi:glycosyltransferase involved in cell wall biosynthesis
MRIGHVSLYYGGGGAGNHVRRIAEAMRDAGHEVYVFTSNSQVDSPTPDWIVPLEVPMNRGFGRIWTHKFNRQLQDELPKYDLDLVHGNPIATDLARIHSSLPRPYVVTLHGSLRRSVDQLLRYGYDYSRLSVDYVYRRLNARIEGRAYRTADHVFPITASVKDDYERYYGPRNGVTVVPNAYSAGTFESSSREGSGTGPELLYVGSFTQRKGLHYLLPAFAEFISEYPDATLHLVGDEENQYLTENLTEATQSNVRIHGWVSENRLHKLYERADVFVFPSIYEGLGTVLLEALQHGLPIVGFDVPGVSDILAPIESATLVQLGDLESFTQAISTRYKMFEGSDHGSSDADFERYAPKQIAEEYVDVYEELM